MELNIKELSKIFYDDGLDYSMSPIIDIKEGMCAGVKTFSAVLNGISILEVEAGTDSNLQGHDSSHTIIRLLDEGGGGTSSRILEHKTDGYDGVEIELHGDSELENIVRGLKFVTYVLEMQAKENEARVINGRVK